MSAEGSGLGKDLVLPLSALVLITALCLPRRPPL